MKDGGRQPNLGKIAEEEALALIKILPQDLQEKLRDIGIIYFSRPNKKMISEGIEPDLLGLFEGMTYADQLHAQGPTEIFLFWENLWEYADHNLAKYRREVRKTLLHELGHYLGLDESAMIPRGLE